MTSKTIIKRSRLKSVFGLRLLARLFPLVALFAILGCGSTGTGSSPDSASVDVPCDTFDEEPEQSQEVAVAVGSTLTLALCANPTTGFQWEEIAIGDPEVMQETDREYQAPDSDALGASGREVWTFDTVMEGQTTLSTSYGQPWEGGVKEEWTFRLEVTVE
jgi:inhibitor of cysteine peptidase